MIVPFLLVLGATFFVAACGSGTVSKTEGGFGATDAPSPCCSYQMGFVRATPAQPLDSLLVEPRFLTEPS